MIDLSSLSASGGMAPIDGLVAQYMALERRPIDTLRAQRDELNVRSAMFNDLRTKIRELRDLAKELSSATDSAFSTHTAKSSADDVATVSAASNASNGVYALTDVVLAKSNRLKTGDLVAGWTAASSGSFSLNGAMISIDAGDTLYDLKYAINHATYASDQRVTASVVGNTLMLEGRTGQAYSIKAADIGGTLLKDLGIIGDSTHNTVASDASAWQGDPAATSWTRVIDLGGAQMVNRLEWSRDATGANTDRSPTNYSLEFWDSATSTWKALKTITGSAMGADHLKQDTFAAVTTSQLRMTITATNGGTPSSPTMDSVKVYSDTATIVPAAELQLASDGSLKVNGVPVTGLTANTGLTKVVHGLTIGLKSAENVTLTVADDTATIKTKLNSFFSKYNSLADFLGTKSAVEKNASTGNYSRGPLNGQVLFTSLESSLLSDMQRKVAAVQPGAPTYLSQIGVSMDSDLHLSVTDTSKVDALLASDPAALAEYLGGADGIAKRVMDRLEPYVVPPAKVEGATHQPKTYIQREQDSITAEQDSIDDQIESLEERMVTREAMYRAQFTRLQAALIQAYQLQQQMSSITSYYTSGQ